jgi:predicted nuclease of predicted toxin-antitoxin system
LRFKLAENIPGAVAGILRSRGHDVDTVLEESLGGQDHPTVLHAATDDGRLLLTLDRGFGDVRAYPPGTHPGIIVLRPDDQRVPTVVAMVETLVDHHDIEPSLAASPSCNAMC